jgi:hypothetical protein
MKTKSHTGKSGVFNSILNKNKGMTYRWIYEQYGHKHMLVFSVFNDNGYAVKVSRISPRIRQNPEEGLYSYQLENIIKYLNKRVIKSSITQICKAEGIEEPLPLS